MLTKSMVLACARRIVVREEQTVSKLPQAHELLGSRRIGCAKRRGVPEGLMHLGQLLSSPPTVRDKQSLKGS